jgi:hypothetical protein
MTHQDECFTYTPFLGGVGMLLGAIIMDEFRYVYLIFLFIDFGCFPVILAGIADVIYLKFKERKAKIIQCRVGKSRRPYPRGRKSRKTRLSLCVFLCVDYGFDLKLLNCFYGFCG